MYFLEFEELDKLSDYVIELPFFVEVNVHVTNDNEDFIPYEDKKALVNASIEKLLEPLLSSINNDADMKLYDIDYIDSDTFISIECAADKVDECSDKLTAMCKELEGSKVEDDRDYTLDKDLPVIPNYDPTYPGGYYETDVHMSEDELYDYFHATLYVTVTFRYDNKYLEIYRK